MNIADKISMLLEATNKTKRNFALATGIKAPRLKEYAKGTDPTISELKSIADYFKISMDELLDENPPIVKSEKMKAIEKILVKDHMYNSSTDGDYTPLTNCWCTSDHIRRIKRKLICEMKEESFWYTITEHEIDILNKDPNFLQTLSKEMFIWYTEHPKVCWDDKEAVLCWLKKHVAFIESLDSKRDEYLNEIIRNVKTESEKKLRECYNYKLLMSYFDVMDCFEEAIRGLDLSAVGVYLLHECILDESAVIEGIMKWYLDNHMLYRLNREDAVSMIQKVLCEKSNPIKNSRMPISVNYRETDDAIDQYFCELSKVKLKISRDPSTEEYPSNDIAQQAAEELCIRLLGTK